MAGQDTHPFADEGQRIAGARVSAGLRQEDLAAKLNVSRQTVTRWETGDVEVPLRRRPSLVAKLGVAAGTIWRVAGSDAARRDVPRGTTPPFAEHVLFTAGRIAELSRQIRQAAETQLDLTNDLGHRAAIETPAEGVLPIAGRGGSGHGR